MADEKESEVVPAAAETAEDVPAPETAKAENGSKELVEESNTDPKPPEPAENSKKDDKTDEPPEKRAKMEPAVKKKSPELLKLWKTVEDDSADFNGWTYLLQNVDGGDDVEDGREAYDAFLQRYPYCYGYWKKYADMEKRKGTPEKVMLVFERGIKAIPLSADLWIHYLNHVRNEYADQPDFIRTQYERSVNAGGRDWRSDKLWDHYVKWEIKYEDGKKDEMKNYSKVLKLYDRILRNQTQGLNQQFDMFRDFVKERNPKDIMEVEDFLNLRKEALTSLAKSKGKSSKSDSKDSDGGKAPGEDQTSFSSDEENQAMREMIIFERRKIFKETEEKVQARWKFEDNIKRPYFHMKPLERGQLKNWNDYLTHETGKENADVSGCEVLFERCLIACALYEEFWLRYVRWCESRLVEDNKKEIVEKIRDIYHRACAHHLPNKVEIRLSWASFEERQKNFEKSSEILCEVQKKHPELMTVMLRRINLERRRENNEDVHKLYKSCIANAKTPHISTEMSTKYARYLRLALNEGNAAIKVLEEALVKDESNPKLYLQLIDVYLHLGQPIDIAKVISVFDSVLDEKRKMALQHRVLFAQRKVDFLEDFGSSITEVNEAQSQLNKLQLTLKNAASKSGSDSHGKENSVGDKKSVNGSSSTTYAATNSASYSAQHNSQYQQYGSRYNSQSYSSSYGSYGNYYGGYYRQ